MADNNQTNVSESSTMDPASIGMASFGIILTLWIIVLNGGLIIGVLINKRRRNDMFLIHIVNIAIADILVGIIVLPILADHLLKGSWTLGKDVCQFWAIADIFLCTVSLISIVMVSYDRFIYLVWPKFFSSGWKQYILGSIMIILPWMVGLSLVLPLWLTTNTDEMPNIDRCSFHPEYHFAIASTFISFFIPAFFAICLNFAILIMLCVYRKRWQARGYVPNAKRPARQVLTVGLVSLIFIFMWCPFFVLLLMKTIRSELYVSNEIFAFTIWLGYLNSGVTPILWLIYPLVRRSYLDLICCCRKRGEEKPEADESRRAMIEEPREIELREI